MEDKELYEKYLALSKQESQISEEKKIIGEMIVKKMTEEKIDKVQSDTGLIKMAERRTYVYTDAVKAKAQEVKELQQKEVAEGLAEEKITTYLRATLR